MYIFCAVINSKIYLLSGGFPFPGSHSTVALKSNNPTVRFFGGARIAKDKNKKT